jgi:hypothetical protein
LGLVAEFPPIASQDNGGLYHFEFQSTSEPPKPIPVIRTGHLLHLVSASQIFPDFD